MPESTQHKLDRIRPPRVQITYDVETGGAIQKKELPLVVGILADLSGQQETPAPRLKDCKFVEIDRDNFNQVMGSIAPRLAVSVDNKIAGEGKTNVELHFKSLDDFEPLAVVKQVEALRQLLDARQKLSDLLAKLDGNDALDSLLVEVAKNPEEIKQLKAANIPAGNGEQANG
ncbi:MAG: type VI secretion system contractile sheath small subunit [Terriglobales bacterium]